MSAIIGCDETPVWFGNRTLETGGSRKVTIRSTGHDKMRCTVMLTGKADGTRCKPMVVFKRIRPVQGLQDKYRNLVICYSFNGWMNEELTHTFIEKVIGRLSFDARLLVWDAYCCHIMVSTKTKVRQSKVDMAVIPGGCTKFLQPADLSWNKSFKSKLSELYDEWMESGEHEFTASGNMRAPFLDKVCESGV